MCFGPSKTNKAFSAQQEGSYAHLNDIANKETDFYNQMMGYTDKMFGTNNETTGILRNQLQRVAGAGPWAGLRKYNPISGQFEAGGGGRGGGGGGYGDLSGGGADYISGYNEGLFKPQFNPFVSNKAEAAMRADASAQTTQAFQDAARGFGARAQQLGDYGGGVEAGALSDIEMARAAQDAQSQNAVTQWAQAQNQENKRSFAPLQTQLQLANAQAYAQEAARQTAFNEQQQAMRASAAAKRASLAAAGKNAAAANNLKAQMFNAQQRLDWAKLGMTPWMASIEGLGNLAQMQDPLRYAQTGLGGLGQAGGQQGGVYDLSSQGRLQTQPQGFGGFLGSLIGGVGSAFTGGLGLVNSIRGGAKNMGNLASYTPWDTSLMTPRR